MFPLFKKRCSLLIGCAQVDALVHRTSQTLQLLLEYDPVRQRLDRLRLGSPLDQLGVPATGRMRLSSPSDAVLERADVVDNSTLKRRSLRCVRNGHPASQLSSEAVKPASITESVTLPPRPRVL
jgi:hypothetical protein